MNQNQQPAYTVSELAERWNVCNRTVLRAIAARRLPAFKAGGRDWRIKADIVCAIEQQYQYQSTPR